MLCSSGIHVLQSQVNVAKLRSVVQSPCISEKRPGIHVAKSRYRLQCL